MLPMSWNGSNGAVHFCMTVARKSLMVCACAPVVRNASAHSAAVSFLMVASRVFLSFQPDAASARPMRNLRRAKGGSNGIKLSNFRGMRGIRDAVRFEHGPSLQCGRLLFDPASAARHTLLQDGPARLVGTGS